MPVSFAKAPLVEIVVELRWTPAQSQLSVSAPSQGGQQHVAFFGNTKLDEFYMRLAGKLHEQGFHAIERLVPPGFPTILQQPVYRYKRPTDPSTVLCQAGPGIFAVNAVPPYKSWKEFFPVAEAAIGALLDARDPSEKGAPFSGINLRYIDAFTNELTGGRPAPVFLAEVLGISVTLPHALSRFLKEGQMPQYGLQLTLPISDGIVLAMSFSEALVSGSPAVLMDSTTSCNKGVPPELKAVIEVLNSAYDAVHAMFVEITGPIHKLMQPTEEVNK
jgi:uncharacterized protein (TIGR04255 family)